MVTRKLAFAALLVTTLTAVDPQPASSSTETVIAFDNERLSTPIAATLNNTVFVAWVSAESCSTYSPTPADRVNLREFVITSESLVATGPALRLLRCCGYSVHDLAVNSDTIVTVTGHYYGVADCIEGGNALLALDPHASIPESGVSALLGGNLNTGGGIALEAGGSFVASYGPYAYSWPGQKIVRVNASGNGSAEIEQILDMRYPDIAVSPVDGRYVVAHLAGELNAPELKVRRYAPEDTLVGPVIDVTNPRAQLERPRVAFGTTGNFLVAWTGYELAGSIHTEEDVYTQAFDADGNALGVVQQINVADTRSPDTHEPLGLSIVATPDGGWLVAWDSDHGVGLDVYGRRLNASGAPIAAAFLINETISDDQHTPYLSTNGSQVVAVWIEDNPSVSLIKARVMEASTVPVRFSDVHAQADGPDVVIRWDVDGDEASSFVIHRGATLDRLSPIADGLSPDTRSYRDADARVGETTWYRVGAREADGHTSVSPPVRVFVPAPELSLGQNFPNPFNPSTTIAFSLDNAAVVTLDIVAPNGQHVVTLFNGRLDSGSHTADWAGLDANDVPVATGVYFARLRAGNHVLSRKMVLLK